MTPVAPEHWVSLKGRLYPLWRGVLDAAHREGLTTLTTTLLQSPTPENGLLAIVEATATAGDRVFSALGEADPDSVAAPLRHALVRMAETRAAARALRHFLNIPNPVAEELPPGGDEQDEPTQATASVPGDSAGESVCLYPGCDTALTPAQSLLSRHTFGQPLCPNHQKQTQRPGR